MEVVGDRREVEPDPLGRPRIVDQTGWTALLAAELVSEVHADV
jgi:hypothetical protein